VSRSTVLRFVVVAIALLASGVANARRAPVVADEPRIEVTLENDRIYKGESVTLGIDVLNVEPQGEPQLGAIEGMAVEKLGNSSMNSSSMVIINGRVVQEQQVGHRYSFRLTPQRAGLFNLPAPTYEHDGKTYRGQAVRLEVIGPQAQELVYFATRVDRNGTRPEQPFKLRLRLFVRKLPAPNDRVDPIAGFGGASPVLRVPWATAPEGLSTDTLDEWLTPLRTREERGFSINQLSFQSNDPFDIFASRRAAVFGLGGRPATEADFEGFTGADAIRGKSGNFYVYELAREFTPHRPGRFDFAPVTVQGEFAENVRGRTVVTKPLFDEGGAVSVVVDDAPLDGRPASFGGAFGRAFTLDASVDPTRARVGDPLTFTLRVRGEGNLESMTHPPLSTQPGFADAFRVEQAGSEWKDGVRTFLYTLRATRESVREIPAVEFSWFDVGANTFASTRSAPVGVTIEDVQSFGSAEIVTGNGVRPRADVERADGLFGNRVDPGELKDARVNGRAYLATFGALALAYAIASLLKSARDRSAADPSRVRRRGAAKRARDRIAGANSNADPRAAADALQSALLGLVADAGSLPESGVTGKEAALVLAAAGIDEALRAEFATVVAAIDGLRFGGAAPDAALQRRASDLTEKLIEALEGKGRLR
jgi:BatD DUF11 like domain